MVGRIWHCSWHSISVMEPAAIDGLVGESSRRREWWWLWWGRHLSESGRAGIWLDSSEKGTVVFLSFWLSLETNPEDSGLSPCHRSPTLVPLLGGFLRRPSWYCYPPLLGNPSIAHITMHLSFSQWVFFRDLPRPGTVLGTRKRAEEKKTQTVWVGGG